MNDSKISKEQIKCAKTLLGKLKIQVEDKEMMVMGLSNNRTASVGAMTVAEGAELIRFLKRQDGDEMKAEKQRHKIIALAHEMKWTMPKNPAKADMKRLDGWCKASGYLHKGLNSYTLVELPKLVTQFEEVYKSYLKGI